MTKHFVRITGIIALILLCMFLPFLPGRYDDLAVTLSAMMQVFSMVSLLLVPLGILWLWVEMAKRKNTGRRSNHTRHFTFATLIILGLIALVLSVVPLTNYQISFGILFFVFSFYWLVSRYFRIRKAGVANNLKMNAVPFYLILIPIVAAVARFTFISPAVQFSRQYVIKKSEPLIAAIEAHYKKKGTYPISLQALHVDILPGMVGVKQYHYEPNGTAYNLYFKQFSDELDVDEIVMYNKLDEHAFAAHVLDILEHSGEELALMRGDRHRYKLSTPHWIYIKLE